MPFTYFHVGPGLLFGLLLIRYVDFPTFVLANVVVDWRAGLVYLGLLSGPRHGWMHSYLGSLAFSFLLIGAMIRLRPSMDGTLRDLHVHQAVSRGRIVTGAVLGVTVTVTIDAFHHPRMQPFLPLPGNPLYGYFSTHEMRLFTAFCLFLGLFVYMARALDVFGPGPSGRDDRSSR